MSKQYIFWRARDYNYASHLKGEIRIFQGPFAGFHTVVSQSSKSGFTRHYTRHYIETTSLTMKQIKIENDILSKLLDNDIIKDMSVDIYNYNRSLRHFVFFDTEMILLSFGTISSGYRVICLYPEDIDELIVVSKLGLLNVSRFSFTMEIVDTWDNLKRRFKNEDHEQSRNTGGDSESSQ